MTEGYTGETKLPQETRRALILTAAVKLANTKGFHFLNFGRVAALCDMPTTPRTVKHYFSMTALRQAVVDDERTIQEAVTHAENMGIKPTPAKKRSK